MKYYPVIDIYHQKGLDLQKKIELSSKEIFVKNIKDADAILVGGGDGFMLDTIKKYNNFEHNSSEKIFFGINCGTLGFLLNNISNLDNLPRSIEEIYIVESGIIAVDIVDTKGREKRDYAVNDIIIGGNINDYYSFYLESKNYQKEILGTGFLVSTSNGSSAYWLNNGGPLIPIDSDLRGFMGIATEPFHYKVFEKGKFVIKVKGKKPAFVAVDGYAGLVNNIEGIRLSPSSHKIRLGFTCNESLENKRIKLLNQKLLGR